MKKLTAALIVLLFIFSLSACSPSQNIARSMGGTTTIELPENEKFLEITWKDNEIWYLTRPMRPDEEAEIYEFKERSVSGMMEGTVVIVEKKVVTNEFDIPEGLIP